MRAAKESQERLLALQSLDTSIAQLAHRIESLPIRKVLDERTRDLALQKDLKVAAETELSDVKHELSRCEVDVEQVVSRIEKDEQRLASGQGSSKELEHLQHELGSLAKRRKELEDVELEVMVRVEDIQVRIKSHAEAITKLEGEVSELKSTKDREIADLDALLAKNQEDRNALAPQIDPELLALYEKLRKSSDGVGAARFSGGQCEGCHLTMNAAELSRVKALPDDEVVRCEECRRILIRVG